MHESRTRVVSHAAAFQFERGVSQRQRIDSRNSNIDRVGLHVLAMFRYARRTSAQEIIAPRRPVSTDNVDLGVWSANRRGYISQNVKDVRIIMLHISGAMIAQKVIKLRFRLRQITLAATIHNIDSLPSVRVIKPQAMFLRPRIVRVNGRAMHTYRSEDHDRYKNQQWDSTCQSTSLQIFNPLIRLRYATHN